MPDEPKVPKLFDRKEEEVVTSKTNGRSYADLVKTLRNKLDIVNIGVKVKKIRRDGKADVLLRFDGGKEKARLLQLSIRTQGSTAIFLMGMDTATTEEEVLTAVSRETKLCQGPDAVYSKRLQALGGGGAQARTTKKAGP